MKRKKVRFRFCRILLAGIGFATLGCDGRHATGGSERFFLQNALTHDVIIVSPQNFGDNVYDSVVLAPNDYYLMESYMAIEEHAGIKQALHTQSPVYIYVNGTHYQVDRNNMDGCLWRSAYHEYIGGESTLKENDNDAVFIFELTEDYIQSLIVLP